jgi:hypothetical protein
VSKDRTDGMIKQCVDTDLRRGRIECTRMLVDKYYFLGISPFITLALNPSVARNRLH